MRSDRIDLGLGTSGVSSRHRETGARLVRIGKCCGPGFGTDRRRIGIQRVQSGSRRLFSDHRDHQIAQIKLCHLYESAFACGRNRVFWTFVKLPSVAIDGIVARDEPHFYHA